MPAKTVAGLTIARLFLQPSQKQESSYSEDTVNGPKPGARPSMNEARELVTQGDILGDEISAILENGDDDGENQWGAEGHPAHYSHSRNERKNQQLRRSAQ
jgi:hypothetical protein